MYTITHLVSYSIYYSVLAVTYGLWCNKIFHANTECAFAAHAENYLRLFIFHLKLSLKKQCDLWLLEGLMLTMSLKENIGQRCIELWRYLMSPGSLPAPYCSNYETVNIEITPEEHIHTLRISRSRHLDRAIPLLPWHFLVAPVSVAYLVRASYEIPRHPSLALFQNACVAHLFASEYSQRLVELKC